MSSPLQILEELGYPLSQLPPGGTMFKSVTITGKVAYISGATPSNLEGHWHKGKVPSHVGMEQAQKAAEHCAANCLLMMARELGGSLDRVERVLRITGYVNADPDFEETHVVINGASELAAKVFGDDKGRGARSALGMAQLPLGVSVEVEMILELKD